MAPTAGASISGRMHETIYLVRHGQTIWNTEGRWQGHLDSALTPRGVAQARSVAGVLRSLLMPDDEVAIESSPLGRARQTAEVIASELGIDPATVVPSPLLMEHDLGQWAGLTMTEREARFPGATEERDRDRWNDVVPGGESYAGAHLRGREWLAAARHAPVTIAVTHEMISRNIQGPTWAWSPPRPWPEGTGTSSS